MEVENSSLSTYDLQSKPSFPFTLNMGLGSSRVISEEHSISELSLASDDSTGAKSKVVEVQEHKPVGNSTEFDAQVNDCSESSPVDLAPTYDVESTVTNTALPHQCSASTADNVKENGGFKSTAALTVQKVYRSYRTRRRLADSAVVAEEFWWQAIDYARLNHSTISFFNFTKPETAASRWNRVILNASKVGKGLSKDAKAQKLAFQHWIEAIDPRHRYGHSLHLYYEKWYKEGVDQPFFYWLDVGDGKEIDLKECPRSKLRQQCIIYLGPQEREHYEYIVVEGRIFHKQTRELLDTNKGSKGSKWIFVMSTFHKFYAGEKKKGIFHHSSFLAGGTTLAAGRLTAENGILKSISAYSGHYRPTDENLDSFLSFLKESGVKLDEVQIRSSTEDYDNYEENKSVREGSPSGISTDSEPPQLEVPTEVLKDQSSKPSGVAETENKGYARTLSGGLQSPKADVPKKVILQRINSKKAASSYQLGRQVSLKWSTGAGPRIGCVADYPLEVRVQALEFVNLSPRFPLTPSSCRFPKEVCKGDMTSVA